MHFVLLFSQEHVSFRIAEIRGICTAYSLNFKVDQISIEEHVFIVSAEEDEIRVLLSRSLLLKSAYLLLFWSNTMEELLQQMVDNAQIFKKYDKLDETFSVRVRTVNKKKGVNCLQIASVICKHVALECAPVNLEIPKNSFVAILEYENELAEEPQRWYFGLLVDHGQASLKMKYNLRERCYIGNTTMDPELAFIQTNIAGVKPNSFVLDPFVGTGGLILPAAEFGAYVVGTELNYQIAKALGKSSRSGVKYLTEKESIVANFLQQDTQDQLLSILIADASQHDIWRGVPIFETIISDPPYGIREKGRKVGKKKRKEHWTLPATEPAQHYPEKQKYSIEATFLDLCDLAAKVLNIGGRLSFWFPVIVKNYTPECLPYHPALELIENCEQKLSKKTSRRLLTYEKHREPLENESTTAAQNIFVNGSFRDAVFKTKK